MVKGRYSFHSDLMLDVHPWKEEGCFMQKKEEVEELHYIHTIIFKWAYIFIYLKLYKFYTLI